MLIADRLQCRVWDLDQVPTFWRTRALVALQAENEARGVKWEKRDV